MQQNLKVITSRQDTQDQSIQRRGTVIVLVAQCLKAICVVLLVFIHAQISKVNIIFYHLFTQ